jgi:lysine-specific demethylase 3
MVVVVVVVDTKEQEVDSSGSRMCHQCQRNDKGAVAFCGSCGRKRYCYPCIQNW